jgi:hypothetical protein
LRRCRLPDGPLVQASAHAFRTLTSKYIQYA